MPLRFELSILKLCNTKYKSLYKHNTNLIFTRFSTIVTSKKETDVQPFNAWCPRKGHADFNKPEAESCRFV